MRQTARLTTAAAENPGTQDLRAAAAPVAKVKLIAWRKVCELEAIPRLGARVVKSPQGDIAIFRTADDEVFALADKRPRLRGRGAVPILPARTTIDSGGQ